MSMSVEYVEHCKFVEKLLDMYKESIKKMQELPGELPKLDILEDLLRTQRTILELIENHLILVSVSSDEPITSGDRTPISKQINLCRWNPSQQPVRLTESSTECESPTPEKELTLEQRNKNVDQNCKATMYMMANWK
jgi:hypothetical protein